MPTYTFTVRATDNAGAFADRTFSINVLNTQQERFVAISEASAWTSPDGINWTLRSGLGGRAVAYGGGKFMIVINSASYRLSNDGVNWNTYNFPAALSMAVWSEDYIAYKPVYSGGKWYIFSSGNVVYTSVDGINWVIGSSFSFTGPSYNTIAAAATNSSNQWTMVSTQAIPITVGGGYGPPGLAYRVKYENNCIIARSSDNLVGASTAGFSFPTDYWDYSFVDINYFNGVWLLSNQYSYIDMRWDGLASDTGSLRRGNIYYSYNGTTWMRANGVTGNFETLSKNPWNNTVKVVTNLSMPGRFTYGNGVFLCSVWGNSGSSNYPDVVSSLHSGIASLFRSTNGKDWTQISLSTNNLGAYVGSWNYTTTDYRNMTRGIMSTPAFSNGVFCLAGPNGILYSYDGATWTRALNNNTIGLNNTLPTHAIHDIAGLTEY